MYLASPHEPKQMYFFSEEPSPAAAAGRCETDGLRLEGGFVVLDVDLPVDEEDAVVVEGAPLEVPRCWVVGSA